MRTHETFLKTKACVMHFVGWFVVCACFHYHFFSCRALLCRIALWATKYSLFFRRIFSLYVSLLFILFLFSSLHDLHRESKSVSYIYTLSESMFFCTSYNTCIYHIQSFFFVSCKWNYFTHSSLSSSFSFLAIRKKKRNILSFSTIHIFCCIYFFLSKENCFINRSCFFFLYWFSHSNSTLTKTRWVQQQKKIYDRNIWHCRFVHVKLGYKLNI